MGADLLINTIWWDRNKPPDWDGFRKHIENLSTGKLSNHPDFEYWEMISADEYDFEGFRKSLLLDHDLLRELIDAGGARTSYVFELGKYTVFITGGMSWGESPSNEFDWIQTWAEIDGITDFGFYPKD